MEFESTVSDQTQTLLYLVQNTSASAARLH